MTFRSIAFFCIILMLSFRTSSILDAQIPSYWNLNKEKGLPTNTVYKTIQDKNNHMWIGTSSGIAQYNSLQFTIFADNTLRDNEFVTVGLDSLNRIWITNFSNQISYIDKNKLSVIELFNTRGKIKSLNLFFSKDFLFLAINYYSKQQNYKLSTQSSVYKIPIKKIPVRLNLKKYLLQNHNKEIPKIIKINHEILVILGSNGSYSFTNIDNKSITNSLPKEVQERFKNWGTTTTFSYQLIGDEFHVVYGGERCLLWNDKGKVIYREIEKTINAVGKTRDNLWLLTSEGIYFINLTTKTLSNNSLFPNYSFSSFWQDLERNIWLATLNKGILIIPSINFQSPSNDQAPFFSLMPLQNDSTFLAGGKNRLALLSKGGISTDLKIPTDIGRILSIYQKNDSIVFAGDNGAYWINSVKDGVLKEPIISKASKNILIDSKSRIWIGRYDCLFRYNYTESPENKPEIILKEKTLTLAEDLQGNIWAGTIANLYKIEENKHILPLVKDSTVFFVKDLKIGIDSSLFVATCNSGVLKINTFTLTVDTLLLPYQDCFNTLLYDDGILWIGGNKGIIHYNTKDKTTHQISTYDGLPSNEINALMSKGSRIWAATSKGLIKFPKNVTPHLKTPPNILIKKVIINGDTSVFNTSPLRLNYNQNNLKIEFETINYYLRGNTEFKYRLLSSENWQRTKQPFAVFTNLKPGNYKFEINLVNNVTMNKLPTLAFSIDTPWWQKIWLQLLMITTIVGLTIWWGYIRQQTVLTKEKRKRSIERKREKEERETQALITELKMTALQAQMNPHFIFNCLNTIQSFIFKNEVSLATNSLSMFSKLIRNVFEYSEEKILSLEKEIDFLRLYIKLEKLRFEQDLEIKVELSDFVSNNLFALSVPPLLIQPIIENAFTHGLMHSSRHKKLSVQFEMEEDYLKCTVCDNGVGREYSAKSNEWEIKDKQSSGLKLTQNRLKTFNNEAKGNNKDKKCFVITDLKDETNGMALGTKIEMFIKTQ